MALVKELYLGIGNEKFIKKINSRENFVINVLKKQKWNVYNLRSLPHLKVILNKSEYYEYTHKYRQKLINLLKDLKNIKIFREIIKKEDFIGIPDLFITRKRNGQRYGNLFVEIKNKEESFTRSQIKWLSRWNVRVLVIRTRQYDFNQILDIPHSPRGFDYEIKKIY